MAFDGLASPMLSSAWHAGDRVRLARGLRLITRWVALGAAPLAFSLLSLRREALQLFGPSFAAAQLSLSILILSALINGVVGITPFVLLMSGRSRTFFVTNLGAALLNVTLNFVLIPRLGIVGAAISALSSVSALQAALAIEVRLLEGVHAFEWNLAKPFLAAAPLLALGPLLTATVASPVARIAVFVAVGLPTYVGLLFLLRPGEEERSALAAAWRRISSRLGLR
jgi:O-antigen/teichoic acid export membrane protein